MRKKRTIIFPLEIVQRELLSKLHLALEAVKRDYRIYIGNFRSSLILSQYSTSPVVFFHKSTWEAQVKSIRQRGHIFLFLDEEVGLAIHPSDLKQTIKHRWGDIVKSEKYNGFFVIGPVHHAIASKVICDKDILIHNTGWPRFDLWRPDIASLIGNSQKPHARDYFLFASSFGGTSLKDFENQLSITQAYLPNLVESTKERHRSFEQCIHVLLGLASYLNTINIDLIVRPHNTERTEDWETIFKEHGNVYVRRSDDLYASLLHANCVLHASSTVGIQYAMTGKVSIALCPVGSMRDTYQCLLSHEAQSLQDVIDIISNPRLKPDFDKFHQLVTALEGPTAASRIVDSLDAESLIAQAPLKLPVLPKTYEYVRHIGWRILSSNGLAKFESWHSKIAEARLMDVKLDSGITTLKVMEAIERLLIIHGLQRNEILVKRCGPQLFSIERA
jgi:surface carbohydrate biosynthesis protein